MQRNQQCIPLLSRSSRPTVGSCEQPAQARMPGRRASGIADVINGIEENFRRGFLANPPDDEPRGSSQFPQAIDIVKKKMTGYVVGISGVLQPAPAQRVAVGRLQQEETTWLENAESFRDKALWIGHVLNHMPGGDHVEMRIRESGVIQ